MDKAAENSCLTRCQNKGLECRECIDENMFKEELDMKPMDDEYLVGWIGNWCNMCEYTGHSSRCAVCKIDYAEEGGSTIVPVHFVMHVDAKPKEETNMETKDSSQNAKSDYGKPQLALVPIEDLWKAIAAIREYGNEKYHDPNNWKNVSIDRYHNALLRHIAACANDINAKDAESGFPHLWHAACNMAFIMALQKMEKEKK